MELAAQSIAYGPVESSIFDLSPTADTRSWTSSRAPARATTATASTAPASRLHGKGIAAIVSGQVHAGNSEGTISSLPTVKLGAQQASELKTALGTIVTFVRERRTLHRRRLRRAGKGRGRRTWALSGPGRVHRSAPSR